MACGHARVHTKNKALQRQALLLSRPISHCQRYVLTSKVVTVHTEVKAILCDKQELGFVAVVSHNSVNALKKAVERGEVLVNGSDDLCICPGHAELEAVLVVYGGETCFSKGADAGNREGLVLADGEEPFRVCCTCPILHFCQKRPQC